MDSHWYGWESLQEVKGTTTPIRNSILGVAVALGLVLFLHLRSYCDPATGGALLSIQTAGRAPGGVRVSGSVRVHHVPDDGAPTDSRACRKGTSYVHSGLVHSGVLGRLAHHAKLCMWEQQSEAVKASAAVWLLVVDSMICMALLAN